MKYNFLNITKRAGWIVGFILLYFFVIRPLRGIYSEYVVFDFLLSSQASIGNITSAFHSPRQVLITFLSNGNELVISHIPQFGFFFLCGMIGLIFFNAGSKAYLGLGLFQLITELFVLFLFWLGIHYTVGGFIISDFFMTYLSPLGCLGFIVFVSMSSGPFLDSPE